jgi:DNA-3-methyladenine glycosylase
LEPVKGVDIMKERRLITNERNLCNGPGKLAQAMGIDKVVNDIVLYDNSSPVWIGESRSEDTFETVATTRIGVDYAGDDALLPWRYYIKDNYYISKK